eukprot:TRINITY_DN96795_c0_g1_i1.p1 TRINITY_DN96795_c0_g1~~TRINITY_DN96795_c0_g1_i1.p1  ORF type:complete len:136 (+),score=25.49 TRINITY_DN96795_c0_g1_i1:180-587(+)
MNGALSDVGIALLTRNPDLKCILLTLPTEDYKELAQSSLKPASKPKHSMKSKTESILLDYTKEQTSLWKDTKAGRALHEGGETSFRVGINDDPASLVQPLAPAAATHPWVEHTNSVLWQRCSSIPSWVPPNWHGR